MKALTVKQPWASLIVDGIKDIENRTWPTKFRGRILIHAGAKPDKEPYMLFNDEQLEEIDDCVMDVIESYENTGAIIGSVEIVDCVQNHISIWAEKGVYNWVLANPIKFTQPIPDKGKLSLWECKLEDETRY